MASEIGKGCAPADGTSSTARAEGLASNESEQASMNDVTQSFEPNKKDQDVEHSVKEADNEDISLKGELKRLNQRLLEVEKKASQEKNEREKLEQIVRLGGDLIQDTEDGNVYDEFTVEWAQHRRNRMISKFREKHDEMKREERRLIAEFARAQEKLEARIEARKIKTEGAPYVKENSEEMKAARKLTS